VRTQANHRGAGIDARHSHRRLRVLGTWTDGSRVRDGIDSTNDSAGARACGRASLSCEQAHDADPTLARRTSGGHTGPRASYAPGPAGRGKWRAAITTHAK
jgi:hypothetical protein